MTGSDRGVARSALVGLAILAAGAAVASLPAGAPGSTAPLDAHATEYLSLVAALGRHDPESVDFHTAPPAIRETARVRMMTREAMAARSRGLAHHIRHSHAGAAAEDGRAARLAAQLDAIAARAAQLAGRLLPFGEELRLLYGLDGAEPEEDDAAAASRATLDRLLPGEGPLARRLARYQRRFAVRRGRLDAALTRAMALCREQTLRHLDLPPGERLEIDYVAGVTWSGYSVYRGGYRSVVQVNRALPFTANDVLTLACHEGYPGHHVYNTLREARLVRDLGWAEASALPLFSPDGFRAEAIVSAAASMAFTADERVRIFRDELFPLIGADPREAARYVEIAGLVDHVASASVPVIQRYLAGEIDRAEAARGLADEALMEQPDALVAYIDRYRTYTFAYTMGRDRYLTPLLAAAPPGRWEMLERLIVDLPGEPHVRK